MFGPCKTFLNKTLSHRWNLVKWKWSHILCVYVCVCMPLLNVVCSFCPWLPLYTSKILFPALTIQTEESLDEDEKLKTKVFFGWVGEHLRQSVVISLSAVFFLQLSLLLTLRQGQNAYTTMAMLGEKRWEPLGRKTLGRVWRKIRWEGGGEKKASVGVEISGWSFNDPCGENGPLLQQILRAYL